MRVRCPTEPTGDCKTAGCPHDVAECPEVLGCGAVFVAEPDFEGFSDCSCGIWFKPTEEVQA